MTRSPTAAQVRAVHAVLNKQPRRRQLAADADSISKILIDRTDGGPTWWYPANGQVDAFIIEAAQRAGRIADAYAQMADEIAGLRLVPAADRRNLKTVMLQFAKVSRIRSQVWAASARPDVDAVTATITDALSVLATSAARVRPYLEA